MRTAHTTILALTLFSGAAAAEEIKGTATLPAADAKADKDAKPTGIVIWVDGVKDAKPPATKGSVSQKDGQFSPSLLVAVAGQTVEFPNDDNIAHNVFSMSAAKKFNLGIYPKGESKEVVFEKTGIIDVFCSLHRHMHAKIVVVPTTFYAVCKPDGTYTIKDIPAGTYKVTAWADGCAAKTVDVTVPEKGAAETNFTLAAEAKDTKTSESKKDPKDGATASAESGK